MALVKIAAKVHADLRFDRLAALANLATRWDAIGRMIPIWNTCTENGSPEIEAEIVDRLFGAEKIAEKIVTVGLAKQQKDRLEIAGFHEHCAWLKETREGGKAGKLHGKKGGRPPSLKGKKIKTPRGVIENNPSAIINYQLPVISYSLSFFPESGSGSDLRKELVSGEGPAPLALACLAKITGVGYGGNKKHLQLVENLVESGVPVDDVIRIAEFCAYGKGWLRDEKMREYLRPETLWGPESHAKYLDAAKAWNGQKTGVRKTHAQAIWDDALSLEAEGR